LQAKLRPLEQQQQRLRRAARERGGQLRPARRRDRRAPQFELSSFAGRKVNLADYKGRIVVLEWFNFECPFVKYHYDQATTMANLAKKYKDKNVVWFAINSTSHTTPQANRAFTKKHDLPYPILDDRSGRVGRAYGAQTTPHMFVIDADGYIVYNGAIDNAPLGKQQGDAAGRINYVDQALSELLSKQKVSMPNTRPYGCTVKYASQ
jgi:peroxiredoxin